MVGAILTQNTSWRNVEKAIQKLKGKGVLNPEGIHHLKKSELASVNQILGLLSNQSRSIEVFYRLLI